jgi:hypothetical protein
MYQQTFAIVFSALTLISCSGEKSTKETEATLAPAEITDSTAQPAEAAKTAPKMSFTTKSGKAIEITEAHPMGMSMSDITVTARGFADSVLVMKDENPVSDVLEADLDKDGFNEYYIITTAAGSGSYGEIIGVASVKDNSLVRITVAEFKNPNDYMGHDTFRVEGNRIIRSYPGYKNMDTNAEPTGENKEISYELKQASPGKYSLEQVK